MRTRLALRAGIAAARDRVHADLADPKVPRPLRLERLAVLEELGDATCVPAVLPLLASTDADVQKHALAVLARVGGPGVGEAVVKAYPALPAALKPRAREILFGRKEWAKLFLALVEAGKVAPADVPVEQVRLLVEEVMMAATIASSWARGPPDPSASWCSRRDSSSKRSRTFST